jgi:ankyrin repeat protein
MEEEAFFEAVVDGNEVQVQKYIDAVKNPGDLKAALQLAAGQGYERIVRLLIKRGVDVHADQESALRFAVWFGRTNVVQYLLCLRADINTGSPSALECAARRKHVELEKLLLKVEGERQSDCLIQ